MIAEQDLQDAGYRESGVIVLVDGVDPSSAAGRERIGGLSRELRDDPAVASVSGFDEHRLEGVRLARRRRDLPGRRAEADRRRRAGRRPPSGSPRSLEGERGVTVGGGALAQKQMNEQTESDLRRAELLAFPFLFLLSLLFFRSLVAALLPLLVGGLAIVGTMVDPARASEVTSVSIFALNLVTGLGLGLAIDYSLFIVSRYREEIARTGPGLQAMRRTMATAGRTVLFSSLTVAGALASLMVFPQNFLYSMGIGGSLVALIAAAISLLVLPGGAHAARRAGQLAGAGLPAPARRARRARRRARGSGTGSRSW